MIVFLIDADNLNASEWIEEACTSLEASEGKIAVAGPMERQPA